MPVDKRVLSDSIREAVGDDGELTALLEQKLLANDNLAATFVGYGMRNKDYTQSKQTLAEEKRRVEEQIGQVQGQIEQYRQQLEGAESEKAKVMKDLATERITSATARAKLKNIKQTYQLSDDEVPDADDIRETMATHRVVDNSADIDSKLAALKKEMVSYLEQKLVPELGGMAQLDIVWPTIRDEHRELTGEAMSAKQMQEIFDEATRRARSGKPGSLQTVWEEKYEVAGLRQKHHDTRLEKELRAKWDAENQAKLSEQALAGVRPTPGESNLRTSQILQHKFKPREESPGATEARPSEQRSAAERQAASGADRAARVWIERRANGIPMGAPAQPKNGKVA